MTQDTKQRLLDAAERLFGSHGFAETSLRALTQEAGANLAAVNYHFGSKEALFQAVVERLVGWVNRERIRQLDELEMGGRQPSVEELMRAFIGPALDLGRDDEQSERMRKLMGRIRFEGDSTDEQMAEVFREVEQRFGPAFRRAAPHLSEEAFFWRLHFTIGVMCSTLFNPGQIRVISRGACDPADADETLEQMVRFVTAGFEAQVSDVGPSGRAGVSAGGRQEGEGES